MIDAAEERTQLVAVCDHLQRLSFDFNTFIEGEELRRRVGNNAGS